MMLMHTYNSSLIVQALKVRHSRAGGNPVRLFIRLDSRLRGNDENKRGFDLIVAHAKFSTKPTKT